jgi:putative NADH-flavin reductase
MRLTVFGSTGRTGRLLVERAMAAGHDVVAFARDPSRLGASRERLTVVHGELTDAAAVERAVAGADAVISALGPGFRRDVVADPLTQGMRNILAAMRTSGVRRLVVLSTVSAADPEDFPDSRIRRLVRIVRSVVPHAYPEIVNVARLVRESDTDWTLVRVTLLGNGPGGGTVRAGYLGRDEVGGRISRADLAAFMLDQVQDTTYARRAPAVSN